MAQQDFAAFTTSYPGLVRELFSDAAVSIPLPPGNDNYDMHDIKALWDTGATGSAITPRLAKKLKLIPLGKTRVGGKTTMSYRFPSIKTIDYVKEVAHVRAGRTYRRNDPVTIRNETTGEEKQVQFKVFDRKYRGHGWEIIKGKLHP